MPKTGVTSVRPARIHGKKGDLAMAVNLTLNDFRNVLGKVNDGDVVLKLDQSELETAVSEIRRARLLFARVQKEDN